jgi:tRNA A37 threonylcarbamoyladenosine biosynthesis protein TsaE
MRCPLKSGLKNVRVPARPKITPAHPPHLFPLHTLAAFIGACGSGKTNAAILLAHECVEAGSFNRVFIISPTYDINAAFHVLPVERKDVYRNASDTQQALRDTTEKIEKDAQQYKRWDRYATVHKRWVEKPHTLTEGDADLLMSMHYEDPIHLDRPSRVSATGTSLG